MTDLWQVGIVPQPVTDVLTPQGLDKARVVWLPDAGSFRFNADPFGLYHGDGFSVLVEAYDYRSKRGEIHYYSYDRAWSLTGRGTALATGFHLSYPFLIRDGGDIYMLPEAHKSRRLTLYRAIDFPRAWEPVADLLDIPAIDATVVKHDGRWWMFYALPGPDNQAMRELHLAYANAPTGPWQPHAANPVRHGLDASRPGGLPFVQDDALHLPMQDCTRGYGCAINVLRVETLTTDAFAASIVQSLPPEGWNPAYPDGLHTLSGDGGATLIDVKRVDRSPLRHWIKLRYSLGKLLRR